MEITGEIVLAKVVDKSTTDKDESKSGRTWVYNGPRSNRPRSLFTARVRDDRFWWRKSLAYLKKNFLRAGAYKRWWRYIYTANKDGYNNKLARHRISRTWCTSRRRQRTASTPFSLLFKQHTCAGDSIRHDWRAARKCCVTNWACLAALRATLVLKCTLATRLACRLSREVLKMARLT